MFKTGWLCIEPEKGSENTEDLENDDFEVNDGIENNEDFESATIISKLLGTNVLKPQRFKCSEHTKRILKDKMDDFVHISQNSVFVRNGIKYSIRKYLRNQFEHNFTWTIKNIDITEKHRHIFLT
eukprot:gb/GECH01010484.1/.p1 GENE.gb/GECH01010484.1/~~gb/GECH01010484.1/.p1  ORF type:complete len:125 (+),score=10.18 gb/GECH01010484.1/:1-375(+)